MPTYDYLCSNCGHQFDEFQKFQDVALFKCPSCLNDSLERIFHTGLYASVKKGDSEIKTLDHLARRNREKMSNDEYLAITKKMADERTGTRDNLRKEGRKLTPAERKQRKRIAKMNSKEKADYIQRGIINISSDEHSLGKGAL